MPTPSMRPPRFPRSLSPTRRFTVRYRDGDQTLTEVDGSGFGEERLRLTGFPRSRMRAEVSPPPARPLVLVLNGSGPSVCGRATKGDELAPRSGHGRLPLCLSNGQPGGYDAGSLVEIVLNGSMEAALRLRGCGERGRGLAPRSATVGFRSALERGATRAGRGSCSKACNSVAGSATAPDSAR